MNYGKYNININKLISIAVIVGAVFVNANSQENPIPLRFEEALKMALTDDPGLMARENRIKIDEYGVSESVANFNPRLDIFSSYSRSSLESEIEFFNPLTSGTERIGLFPEDKYNFGITLSHNFFTFGKRSALKRAGKLGIDISKLEKEEYKRSLYDKLARIFLKSLLTRDNLTIRRNNVSRARKKLEIVRSMISEGLASDYDSIRAELLVSRYESDLNISEEEYTDVRADLKALLNMEQTEEIMPIGDLKLFETAVPESPESDIRENIDILKLEKSIEIQDEFAKYHKRTFFPSLSYSASYNWQNGYQPDLDRIKDFWTVGLSLNMNLFDGGGRRSRVARARYESRRAGNLRSDLALRIKADIKSSQLQIAAAEDEIVLAQKRLELAGKGLEIAEARYREGFLSISDLLDSELEKAEAEMGLNLSVYRLALARLNLKSAAGYYPEIDNSLD
ncbi:MAG: TolC family protein [Candidatus Zixiibacteriota bacterium]|nr:MAG: TolC family protein [candidate division Zixibacteria bacterium]